MAADADPHSFLDHYNRGELNDFFELAPGDTDTALALERPVDRPALVAALRRQALRLGAPAAALSSLARLEHPNSRVVVTGQQTGLLLGPLFTLSKAFTAIRLAASLDSEDRPVVPLFWMASQDHDHAEIDHAYLLDLDEVLHRVEVDLPSDTPAGRMPFDRTVLEQVTAQLEGGAFRAPHRAAAVELLKRSAARADTFADWFGSLLYALLGDYGLVIIDPLDRDIAALFVDVIRREIADPLPTVRAVLSAAEMLLSAGIEPQLGRGEGATNLFLEQRDAGGVRAALRRDHGDFWAGGRSYSATELLAVLDDDPTLVTPAAALRPVTQDYLLPTVATVVGPGELRYFAQLRGVYHHHGVAMSLVWPRAEATVLEPPVGRILAKYGLSADDFVSHGDSVRARILLDLHGHGDRFDLGVSFLASEIAALIGEVAEIDPTLIGTVERASKHLAATIDRLRTKSAAALARRDDVTMSQFARLSAHLLPLGQAQERLISPFGLFLKFGVEPVIDLFATLPAKGHHLLEIV